MCELYTMPLASRERNRLHPYALEQIGRRRFPNIHDSNLTTPWVGRPLFNTA